MVTVDHNGTAFWHEAYQLHGPSVMAFLRSRVRSRDDAEELLQETFVRVMRAGADLPDQVRARAYLFTTAHNLARNHWRRRRVSPLVDAEAPLEVADVDTADARARLRSLFERLEDLVAGLAPAHRTAFQLGVLDRLPYREIADRTGWSLAQVKINVYRARRRVVDGLGDLLPGGEVRA